MIRNLADLADAAVASDNLIERWQQTVAMRDRALWARMTKPRKGRRLPVTVTPVDKALPDKRRLRRLFSF